MCIGDQTLWNHYGWILFGFLVWCTLAALLLSRFPVAGRKYVVAGLLIRCTVEMVVVPLPVVR